MMCEGIGPHTSYFPFFMNKNALFKFYILNSRDYVSLKNCHVVLKLHSK